MRTSDFANIILRTLSCLMAAALCLGVSGCKKAAAVPSPVQMTAKVEGKSFYLLDENGAWQETFVTGVNIGASKPGYWPGEFGVTKADYLAWFSQIAEMNVRFLRVYVLQMPVFYEAFYEYNQSAAQPLYLLHGVYLNEDMIETYNDAFSEDAGLEESFQRDTVNMVNAVHGNASVEKKPGNAGGEYTFDISPYIAGYILGIEWSAPFVIGTNEAHPEKNTFAGEYIYTENASPFEVFLAEAAETCIAHEISVYGTERPVALSNWATTDPLTHPDEPNPDREDAVSVDVEHIRATDAFHAGLFASYHVYPYYPDFLNYDSNYLAAGSEDTYLTYITALNDYHSMPVLIAEYGIPTSRGIAHKNIHTGFNQGHIEEAQQGEMLVSLTKDIRSAGLMGGLIFSWQDEWFKRTWNTMSYEWEERRPYWTSAESPEQNFGILAYDPGETELLVRLDGKKREWSREDVVAENDDMKISAKCDEKYLYLMVEVPRAFSLETDTLYVPISTIGKQGSSSFGTRTFGEAADFVLVLNGRENSRLLIDPYYDAYQYEYSVEHSLTPVAKGQDVKGSSLFHPIQRVLDRGWKLPASGKVLPFTSYEAGLLTYGNGDPDSKAFHSLSDFCFSGRVVEVRLPWTLLNVMDPSTRKVIADMYETGWIAPEQAENFYIGVYWKETGGIVPMGAFTWAEWDLPTSHPRLKKSYAILQDYFASLNRGE